MIPSEKFCKEQDEFMEKLDKLICKIRDDFKENLNFLWMNNAANQYHEAKFEYEEMMKQYPHKFIKVGEIEYQVRVTPEQMKIVKKFVDSAIVVKNSYETFLELELTLEALSSKILLLFRTLEARKSAPYLE